MKKLLLFAVGSLMAFPSLAQDEDMTYLITNATFDEDLTWQADGSMKPAVETKRLSDRTIAAIACLDTNFCFIQKFHCCSCIYNCPHYKLKNLQFPAQRFIIHRLQCSDDSERYAE